MLETRGVPKENIISGRDFAQLDQQLDQTPTISTLAVSGIVCFINNKTSEYLENISQEEKCKMITRAIQEAPGRKAAYREKGNHTRKETYADEGKKRKM